MTDFIKNMAMGVLLFALVVGIFVGVLGEGANTYDITPSEDYNTTYGKINSTIESVSNLTREMNEEISVTGEETTLDVINSLIKGAFTGLKIITNVFGFARVLIEAVLQTLGIPAWIVGVLISILLLAVGFSIMKTLLAAR